VGNRPGLGAKWLNFGVDMADNLCQNMVLRGQTRTFKPHIPYLCPKTLTNSGEPETAGMVWAIGTTLMFLLRFYPFPSPAPMLP
jgi:hypothetical protein